MSRAQTHSKARLRVCGRRPEQEHASLKKTSNNRKKKHWQGEDSLEGDEKKEKGGGNGGGNWQGDGGESPHPTGGQFPPQTRREREEGDAHDFVAHEFVPV